LNELYRQLFNPQLYLLAYGRIYANHGAVNIHVLVADVLERRRFGMSAGGGCRGVLRLRGAQVGADSGGRQGFPVRASRMPVRTSTPCLRMVSM
jgi:hypothetical protein